MGTLKPQSNGPLYTNTEIGTLAVDVWAVKFGTARRGLGDRAAALPSSLLAVPNVTAHTSTASVLITLLLYNGPLLCSFNVPVKGLTVVSAVDYVLCNTWQLHTYIYTLFNSRGKVATLIR